MSNPTMTYHHPKYGTITFVPHIFEGDPEVGLPGWFVEDITLIGSTIDIDLEDMEEVLNLLIEHTTAEISRKIAADDEAMQAAYEKEVAEDFEAYGRRIDPTRDI